MLPSNVNAVVAWAVRTVGAGWKVGRTFAAAMALATTSAKADGFDPFRDDSWSGGPVVTSSDPFDDPAVNTLNVLRIENAGRTTTVAAPVATATYFPYQTEPLPSPAMLPPSAAPQVPNVPQPGCGVPGEKPIGQLTINIQIPKGELPTDQAAACWQQLNGMSGPLAGLRLWPQQSFTWAATCLAHQPLYFEEANLERYGYGCCDCLQSACSAAHFFATVPALPYCMAVDCPGECQYTLGHYRPGSCPPWRYHRPPCSALGGISQAGVLTGFIFLIP